MKKFILIAIVAVLALTGGAFAYTFTTTTTTIGVTVIESDFAEVSVNGTYSPPTYVFGKFAGTWPDGTLFDIAPHTEYTGDLGVRVYLVNTGDLISRYQHLNMALEFQDSTGTISDNQAEVQVLNLSNAEVTFDWVNGTGTGPYYVEVTGGGYRLHQWRTGLSGSASPQIWCEVVQR